MEPLTVPGNLDSLDNIRDYIKAAAAASGLDKKATYHLVLAVDEIATNIVTHGYNEAGLSGGIVAQTNIDAQNLTITLEDTAIPYDPQAQAIPDDLDTPLAERPIGGLGVYLALRNVDTFHYERVNNRNRNIFVMHRPAAPAAD
jgi:serine/threonine-protein kinase RsbW